MIASVSECVKFLKQTGEIVLSVHAKSYLHSDLKGTMFFWMGQTITPSLLTLAIAGKFPTLGF